MTKTKMCIKTISILVLVTAVVFYGLCAGQVAEIKRYEEFRARQALWKEANPEVENEIKDCIDDVDWFSLIKDFASVAADPAGTFKTFYEHYGVIVNEE